MIDWANTPGGYYAIAYWLSCCLMIKNSPRKLGKKESSLIVVSFGIVLFVLMSVSKGLAQWLFLPFVILFLIILWATHYFVCQYNAITALYFTIRTFIMGEFVASLEWQIFYYTVKWKLLPLNLLVNMLLLIFVDSILILLLYQLEKRNREVNETLQISKQELISAGIIAAAIFGVSNVSFVFAGANLASAPNIAKIDLSQLFLIRTLVDLGGVAILYAYHVQLGELNMRYEVEHLQYMLEMQHNNYEMLKQSVNVVDQKYHDLKYQISVLKSEANTKKSMEYLNQMERDIKSYEAQNKTGNKTLDTILTGKSLYCQNNWIELIRVVDGEALAFMDSMDISTLFGNMLDNAIESVSKIEGKEKRLIQLTVMKQKGFLRIRMENCYGEEPKFENGVLTTSKEDSKYHGFGMKSIQSIVKKYDGSMTIQAKNGWFELRILIPLQS